jgi:hypothetical protein
VIGLKNPLRCIFRHANLVSASKYSCFTGSAFLKDGDDEAAINRVREMRQQLCKPG